MAILQTPGLRVTFPAGSHFTWTQAAAAGTNTLFQTRAAATFSGAAPTSGAEQLELLVDNTTPNASVDVIVLVRWGGPDTTVGSPAFPESILTMGALAAGLQRMTANEVEIVVPTNTKRKISLPTRCPLFQIGLYTDAAPPAGQIVVVTPIVGVSGAISPASM